MQRVSKSTYSKLKAYHKKPKETPKQAIVHAAVRSIKRIMETKYVESNTVGVVNPTSAGIITDHFPIPQGINQNQRTGNNISPMSMEVRGHFTALSVQNTRFRQIYFVWKPDNANPPTLGSILAVGPSGTPDVNSCYNLNNKAQYRILADKNYYCQISTSPTDKTLHLQRFRIKKLPKNISFTTGLNTGENHIYSIALSDGAVAANSVGWVQQNRITYKDA